MPAWVTITADCRTALAPRRHGHFFDVEALRTIHFQEKGCRGASHFGVLRAPRVRVCDLLPVDQVVHCRQGRSIPAAAEGLDQKHACDHAARKNIHGGLFILQSNCL